MQCAEYTATLMVPALTCEATVTCQKRKSRGFQITDWLLPHSSTMELSSYCGIFTQTFAIVPTSISRAPAQRLEADYVIDSS